MIEDGPPPGSVHGPVATPRLKRVLVRGIAATIAVKLALLIVLYLLFFSPSHRPHIDDAAVDRLLLPSR